MKPTRWMLLLALCAIAPGGAQADVAATEAQRIDYLIRSVEQLPGAKFIRNGAAYDARAAAEHLRVKLRAAGGRVKTADDFIRYCGSRSSVSGQPYEIRLADGTRVTSEAFLRRKLGELQALGK